MDFQRPDPAHRHPKLPGIPSPARWAAFALVSAAVHALILYQYPGPSVPEIRPEGGPVAVRLLELPAPPGKGRRGEQPPSTTEAPKRRARARPRPGKPARAPQPASRTQAQTPPSAPESEPRRPPPEKRPIPRASPRADAPPRPEPDRAATDVIASPNARGPAVAEARPEEQHPEPSPHEPRPPTASERPVAPAPRAPPPEAPTRTEPHPAIPEPSAVPPDPWALGTRPLPRARAAEPGTPSAPVPSATRSEGEAGGQALGSGVAHQARGSPGGSRASNGEDDAAAREGYLKAIRALIERHKRYPRAALRRGQQGTCVVRVEVDRSGELERVEIVRSSGFRSLDRAAVDTFRRGIRRFPPAPDALPGDPLVLEVPVVFRLSRR